MLVALHDADGTHFPNLALAKLSAWHKAQGDAVQWFAPGESYDKVYSSKVFTWTPDDESLPEDTIKGGTGYGIVTSLPYEVEHTCPDYSLYGSTHSQGFLTRGCPNKCTWCFVPKKEGGIRANATLQEFVRHRDVVFMDNNVLAHPHGVAQTEKAAKQGLRIDFNQGLDARLVDDGVARLLAKLTWLHPPRFACDRQSQMKHIERAARLLRWHNCTPRNYFIYTLIGGPGFNNTQEALEDALERVRFLKGMALDPFAQPYRAPSGEEAPKVFKHLARYVNRKQIFKSCTWEQYLKKTTAQPTLIDTCEAI